MASEDINKAAEDPKASPDYIRFPVLPPGDKLNRWSQTLTRGHDFPGAQVGSNSPDPRNCDQRRVWGDIGELRGSSLGSRPSLDAVLIIVLARPCCTLPASRIAMP